MYMDYQASLPELSKGVPHFRRLDPGPQSNEMYLYFRESNMIPHIQRFRTDHSFSYDLFEKTR
jgi:hypothetical protein